VTGRSHEALRRGGRYANGSRAMSKIALHLSKCRVTSCLVVLLMGLSSMVFGQEPTPGKYVCDIANIVGLQTSSAERQQKFFVTIEDNKQLPEDWCFSADALDDLKKLRRGEKPGTNSKTQFLDLSMFFTACQAQFRLSTNGGPIDSLYHSDNLNIFRDEFSQFWIKNGYLTSGNSTT
jgi:hypothetical protein